MKLTHRDPRTLEEYEVAQAMLAVNRLLDHSPSTLPPSAVAVALINLGVQRALAMGATTEVVTYLRDVALALAPPGGAA
ncbi:hypothetical protein [Rhodospirillum sp. A1_3_36]|uniref:hypothetical protein n=1 Tax=Rhodospirillum sp. A1_3_36 TaxID=3391666 RepID=UPI0039A701C2